MKNSFKQTQTEAETQMFGSRFITRNVQVERDILADRGRYIQTIVARGAMRKGAISHLAFNRVYFFNLINMISDYYTIKMEMMNIE